MKSVDDIVVFSHLRWNFVYQRPQHLLSRLKRGRRVLFIEEPHPEPGDTAHVHIEKVDDNLLICTPVLPDSRGDRERLLKHALDEMFEKLQPRNYALWFYTPMALPLASRLAPEVIVYDCMDELSAFKNAPPELLEREPELLRRADLVFTGGPSLFRAKRNFHPHVHCFPSSVDRAHFGKGAVETEHPLQQHIPHPRLGYFGVIDERLDLNLLRAVAESHPEWQIVMVGPVVKIDPANLPRAANIHYLGSQQYEELPALLSSWDVCLMPFALNEATRFISPTKVLEYMAAHKMIVSTAITDIVEPYSGIVFVANNADEFIAACESALALDQSGRDARRNAMNGVLNRTSWDETARQMERLIETTAREKRRTSRRPREAGTVIIGAGPTGLSAAYHLEKDYTLIERNETVGGWCRSIEKDGFIFDYVGHIMFSKEPYVHRMYKILLGDNVHWQDREAWIYSKNTYTRYPFQQSLYGLPPDVIRECLMGAIDARFGSADKSARNGHTNGHHRVEDCCGDGILEATAPFTARQSEPPRNFEEFIYRVWGAGIAKHFAIPYNRKLWAVPLHEMETSWLGGRVPLPDLGEMIEGAISPAPKPVGPNARFGYPLRGGFQSLMTAFLPHLRGDVQLQASVAAISPSRRTVKLEDGRVFRYEQLISTMPLPRLIESIGLEAPPFIREAAAGLRHTSVRGVHIGVGRPNITEKHWIYYPEETVFHRIFVQGNASPHCNPPGGFGVTFEITYNESKPLPCDGQELVDLCVRDARRVGFIREDDRILTDAQVDLPFAYVIYDHGRSERVRAIREWLKKHRILLAGRYSEWEYYNSDHAFIAGKNAAAAARELSNAEIHLSAVEPADAVEASQEAPMSPA